MKTGIYTIINKITNHIYVGAASNIQTRMNNHRSELRKKTHSNSYLQRAFNKYGEENFLFEELEECDKKYLYSQEHYWATILNVFDKKIGYNLKPTHPNNISLCTKESRNKIREKALGRKWSNEYKQLFKENQLGRKQTKDHRIKAARGKFKIILQFSKKGEFIKEWESGTTASINLNLSNKAISNCCLGRLKTSGGFIWKYKNNL